MANCTTINSLLKGCNDGNNIGGIYEVYIGDMSSTSISANTQTGADITAHTYTAFTSNPDLSVFQFNRNVGNWTVEPTIDLVNGSTIYTVTLTLQFNRREGSKSRALTILGEGQRYLAIIVKGADGQFTVLDNMQLSGGAEESGTNKVDGSKYTVQFTSQMENRPFFISQALVTTLTT